MFLWGARPNVIVGTVRAMRKGLYTTASCATNAPVVKLVPKSSKRASLITLRPSAVERIKALQQELLAKDAACTPILKIGVRSKGCSGNAYHLSWIFDIPEGNRGEIIEQEGIRIAIEPRALISIIGSEVEWTEDQLSSQFLFLNPNVKETCGCGLSFTIDESSFYKPEAGH